MLTRDQAIELVKHILFRDLDLDHESERLVAVLVALGILKVKDK